MTSTITLRLKPEKKVFFASDFHLGAPDYTQSRARERKIVDWLTQISPEAEAVFLVGDIFDFWFEYQAAVPKGFVRLLGKIAELTDQGIPVFIFSGNHDMWMFNYLPKELGVQIFHKPQVFDIQGFRFLIGHGDGLGPGDNFYKFLKTIFRNPLCQWLFARLHPNFGIGLASFLSRRSRARNLKKHPEEKFLGKENEWLYLYCASIEAKEHFDYYVFGHRHLPLNLDVGTNSRYINLGEWLRAETYAVFDGKEMDLKRYSDKLNTLF
jgi:UDP-2,3-diacylglucosamine hydrolase